MFESLFNAMNGEPDLEYALVDETIVQVQQKASGAKGGSASSHRTLPRRADKAFDAAFDADWLLQDLDERGATAVIPPKANRKVQRDYDIHMYKWRHLIENYFARLKEFRA